MEESNIGNVFLESKHYFLHNTLNGYNPIHVVWCDGGASVVSVMCCGKVGVVLVSLCELFGFVQL